MSIDCISFITKIFPRDKSVFIFSQMPSLHNPDLKTAVPLFIFFFLLRIYSCHRVYCLVPPSFQMPTSHDVSTGNYYDVIFLPKWRTQIWGKIDLGGHRFEWEAIIKDTDLRSKITRIWGYSNFIGHGFVGRHRFEERTRIWGRTWISVLHIYRGKHEKEKLRDQVLIIFG